MGTMSLKAFHILFVVITTLFCVGLGLWAFRQYSLEREASILILGIGSFVFAVGLIVYGKYVLKKLRGIGYL